MRSPPKHRPCRRLAAPLWILAVLAGCGDDSVAPPEDGTTTGATGTSGEPSIPTTAPTTDDIPTTGEMPPGDSSTSGAPPTTGDPSTTGAPTECQGLVDGHDDDDDGVENTADNCPCEANPNQLDFDGDAVGNVCDLALQFSVVDGAPPEQNRLTTTAHAKKALECTFAVELDARDGVVEVELDDAGTARLHLASVQFTDTPELDCVLGEGITVKLEVQQFFAEGPDAFTVSFPFALADHQAGTLIGKTDAPHDIVASAIIDVTESPYEQLLPLGQEQLLAIPGVFPTAMVSVLAAEQQLSLVFADDALVLFEQTTEAGIAFKLTGLTGTLRLRQ